MNFRSESNVLLKKQNWFAKLSFSYLVVMSSACLSAFSDTLCQHTHHYDRSSPNMDPVQSMPLKKVGH